MWGGVERGNGTHTAREALLRRFNDMALSSQSRFVRVPDEAKGHNVQLVEPELIAEEVRWVPGLA